MLIRAEAERSRPPTPITGQGSSRGTGTGIRGPGGSPPIRMSRNPAEEVAKVIRFLEGKMKIDREEFLRRLESVQAGLSKREILEQSDCFIFQSRRVVTYNDEVSCRGPSGLDDSFQGAAKADKLLEVLREYPDEEVEVEQTESAIRVSAKRRRSEVRMEADVVLPVDQVERPAKGSWRKLPNDFGDAVALVQPCASVGGASPIFCFVNVAPDWLEACDNLQMCRWTTKTPIESPFLLRQDSVKHVTALGMIELAQTGSWAHFRNGGGVILSCRRYMDEYDSDSIDKFLSASGPPVQLPRGLADAAKRCQIFSMEDPKFNRVRVDVEPGRVIVSGEGSSGRHMEWSKASYKGKPLSFRISPVLLMEIVKEHADVQLCPGLLKVDGGRFRYAACLIQDDGKEESPRRKRTAAVEGAEK